MARGQVKIEMQHRALKSARELLKEVERNTSKETNVTLFNLAFFFGCVSAISIGLWSSWRPLGREETQRLNRSEKGLKAETDEQTLFPGLQNLGNNCFLNVILQALASSTEFLDYLNLCTRLCEREWGEVSHLLPLTSSLKTILYELSQPSRGQRALNPEALMRELSKHAGKFDFRQQQDALEALSLIRSAAFTEGLKLRQLAYSHLSIAITPQIPQTRLTLGSGKWPLEGSIVSVMECIHCGHQFDSQVTTTNEIILPVPAQNLPQPTTLEACLRKYTESEVVREVECTGCTHLSAIRTVSAISAVQSIGSKMPNLGVYENLETLLERLRACRQGDTCRCPSAMNQTALRWPLVHSTVSRKLLVGKTPKVLCLQIQRLSVSMAGFVQKSNEFLQFPPELDLKPFTFTSYLTEKGQKTDDREQPPEGSSSASGLEQSYCVQKEAGSDLSEHIREDYLPGTPTPPRNSSFRPLTRQYKLASVVVHLGNSAGGHYVVFRKLDQSLRPADEGGRSEMDSWISMSDERVQIVDRVDVFSSQASVLFYEKQDSLV